MRVIWCVMKGGNTEKMVSVPGERERGWTGNWEVKKGNNVHYPLYEIIRHGSKEQLMRIPG